MKDISFRAGRGRGGKQRYKANKLLYPPGRLYHGCWPPATAGLSINYGQWLMDAYGASCRKPSRSVGDSLCAQLECSTWRNGVRIWEAIMPVLHGSTSWGQFLSPSSMLGGGRQEWRSGALGPGQHSILWKEVSRRNSPAQPLHLTGYLLGQLNQLVPFTGCM